MLQSQTQEIEQIVTSYFPEQGFFLEIGCWDGENMSQTAFLEREHGWKGLCVDPFPKNFENRSCMLCNKAVSANGEPREFIWVKIDRRHGGDVSFFSGFLDSVQYHWETIKAFCTYELTRVDTITVAELYLQYSIPQFVEFLSVDTEGSELEIFYSIDLNIFKFGIITFEHNGDNGVRRAVGNRLERYGYKFLQETMYGLDDVYVWGGL